MLFLALPIIQLLLGSFTWWQRLLGLTGVLGFIAGYVWAFSTPADRASRVNVPSTDLPTRVLLRELAVQGFFTVLTLPALGWWAVCFFPFFCSLILFSTTLRRGIPTVVIATGLLIAASLLWNTHPESHWQVLGISLTEIPIIIARIAVELQERRTAAERELALVSQREALGRDVHDILGHSLTVLTLKAEVARRLIERDPAAASRELDEVITLARGALADVRSTVTRLRSPDLASQMEATRTALSAARIRVDVTGSAQDIPERQRALMAWALREATTNVVRHSQAATVTVHLEPGLLRVSDDGVGLAGDQPGNGLAGLRSRCEQEGGSLTMTSPLTRRTDSSGAGTTDTAGVTTGGTRLEVRLP
ncbi:two-component sensor histidine kinase [Actinomyces sp. HMSC08A09]|uniref:sensor histidine kinase n=1 Tax=Actinomyces TaxID=1654 RepID=UPI0008A231C7|nr:histidine kinase [Actinomyces oris]OFT35571.1 two-component sensor histidine kinase [Actinomyces sp. HMSC08A09]